MSKLSKIIKPLMKITQQLKDYDQECEGKVDVIETKIASMKTEQGELEQERKLTAKWLAAVPSVDE